MKLDLNAVPVSTTIFGGKYLVSNDGTVTNTKTGRVLTPVNGILTVYDEDKQKVSLRLNRVIAEIFIPNPKNYPYVVHVNGVLDDFRVENLAWSRKYYKTTSCLVFFDSTGVPAMFDSYKDFAKAIGSASNRDIAKLIRGEIDSLGGYYSQEGIRKQIFEYFTDADWEEVQRLQDEDNEEVTKEDNNTGSTFHT